MPIPWKAIQRRNPRDPNAAAKYYAMDVTRALLDEEDAAHAIAVRSGMSEGDLLGVLRTLADWLGEALSQGDAVSLARIGSFSASLTSEGGSATPDELRRLAKDTGVNFRPAPDLRRALEAAGDQFTGEVVEIKAA